MPRTIVTTRYCLSLCVCCHCWLFFSISHFNPFYWNHQSKCLRTHISDGNIIGLGWWSLTPLSTIFQLFSWWSVLLVGETRVPGENNWPVASRWQSYHIAGFELTTSVVIGIDCIDSYKSNYYMIMTTMAPGNIIWKECSLYDWW